MEPKTFRGLSLAEVERKVRAELGDDAVVVRQREGLTGGVGGFFQRKLYEVDALPGAAAPAGVGGGPDSPAFTEALSAALEPEIAQTALEQQAAVQPAVQFVADELHVAPPVRADGGSAAALAALFAPDRAPAPAPGPQPVAEPEPDFEFDFPVATEAPLAFEPEPAPAAAEPMPWPPAV